MAEARVFSDERKATYRNEEGKDVPVVMVHGCCLSSKTWETTPDGRMGWNEYFVRKNRAVYLADQVSRARSGFDGTKINAVRTGSANGSRGRRATPSRRAPT